MHSKRLRSTLALLLLTALTAAPAVAQTTELLGGKWVGRFHDLQGNTTEVELIIAVSGSEFSGTAHIVPPGGGGRAVDIPFNGTVSGDTITFLVRLPGMSAGQRFDGLIRDARPHALQSIHGLAEVRQGARSMAGAWMLWRHAE